MGTDHTEKTQKVAYGFMQKYYHVGAFRPHSHTGQLSAEDEALLSRDYNLPTGEDKMDKSVLPGVLHKRTGQFGRKGNSKYTHLTDQDTTNFNPVERVQPGVALKMQSRMAGIKAKDSLERPSERRRRF